MENRTQIATLIYQRLLEEKDRLMEFYKAHDINIGYCFIDDLLPEVIVEKINSLFPKVEETKIKKNLREFKHVAYQMNKYHPFLEEVIYAFQDQRIVSLIADICGLKNIYPDEKLYAGGLSMMQKDNYLNPHLDNSHDKDRNRWRVLNLLYYVTPNWKIENGGNLELWSNGVEGEPITITSQYNRLVIMATHQNSWHSVSKVNIDGVRCCVSNYYFSSEPYRKDDSFHITSFRGRPNQKIRDIILRFDAKVRGVVRGVFKTGIRENPHQYKK